MKIIVLLSFSLISASLPSQSYTSYFTGDTANVNTSPLAGTVLMGGAGEHDNANEMVS
jgi:hypothetical protein